MMKESSPGKRLPNDIVIALALSIFLAAVYLLTTTSNMQITSDEGVNLALTENVAKFFHFDVEQMATLTRMIPAEHGLDGLHYSKYGLAQALLGAPLYWLAQSRDTLGVVNTVLLFNAVVTAAAGGFVYLLARQLGYGPGLSVALALLYGLASPVWVYTKRYMSEPLSALALTSAAYFAVRAVGRGPVWPLLAGLCAGIAVLNKTANGAFLPIFLLFLLLAGSPENRQWYRRLLWRPGWGRAVAFALPVAVAAATVAYYNWIRFGEVLHTGYGPQEGFSVPIYEGLAGLLFSPGKGAFLYFPLLVLLFFWTGAFLRRHLAAGLLLLGLLAAHFLLYAEWWIWWGGWNWGVRFLVPAWGFAILLLAEGLRNLRRPEGFAYGRLALVGVLVALSVGVQLLGVLVDHTVFIASLMPLSVDPDRLTLVDIANQPILNQFRYLDPGHLDFGWMRTNQDPPFDQVSLTALATGVITSLAGLALVAWQRGRGVLSLLAVVATVVVVANGSLTYLEETYGQEDRSARQIEAYIAEHMSERAGLVYLAPQYTSLWANASKLAIPTFGTYEEDPLKPATEKHLEQMAAAYDEVWLVSQYAPAGEGNGIERWLATHGFRRSEQWYGPFRLASYRLGGPAQANFAPVDANLGGAVRLLGYIVEDGDRPRRPGETINVTLRWQCTRSLDQDYTVFVHLLDDQEQVWGQQDVAPGGGFAPTSGWQVGQTIDDHYAIPLKEDAPAGPYRIEIGMYLPADGKRLPVLDAKGAEAGNRILLPTTLQAAP
ncbi:MAG: ArnT family glycosyltransferase [Chloroflexota bacterium]